MFGNFGQMGFNFGNMNLTSEAIEKKLKDSNTTVDDLLKEEELLQEFRSQNEKLINFFDKDKVKQLLDYIIKEHEDEKNKGYRFPFICSQIFGLEIEKIMKYFFMTNKEIEEEKEREKEKQKEKEKDLDDSDDTDSEKLAELNNNNDEKPEQKEENKEKENEDKKQDTSSENKKEEEKKKEEENKEKAEEKKDVQKEEKDNEKKEDKTTEDKNKEEPKKEGENEVKDEKNKEEETKEEPKKENEEIKNTENKENEKKEEEKEKKEGEEEKKENEEEKDENEEEEEKPENKIELLDYFFTFLPDDSEQKLNYVLSGYFSSLIVNLLSLNPRVFFKYIYQKNNNVLYKLVNHCYRKSISETLSKLLNFENYFINDPLDDETKEDMDSKRKDLFMDIFEKIDINMDNEDLSSIYYLITGLFDPMNIMEEKHIFKEIIENKKIMRSLITKPFHELDLISFNKDNFEEVENRRKNFSVIIDIILFFLYNIQKLKLELLIILILNLLLLILH